MPGDSGTPDEDAGTPSCPDLMPTGDAELVISKIDIATRRVEVFNPGSAPFTLGEHQWCDQPRYDDMAGTGPTTIPAGGYAIFTLPAGWLGASGELAIYSSGPFGTADNVIDFVCWGTPRAEGGSRRDEATAGGNWSGDCAPAPTMGAIVRRPSTSGADAASYDTTVAFEPTSCD